VRSVQLAERLPGGSKNPQSLILMQGTLRAVSWYPKSDRELSWKKLQNDPHFTALTLNDEQRAELHRVTALAVAKWKANMTSPFSIARRYAGR
jgi:hypothetical protein